MKKLIVMVTLAIATSFAMAEDAYLETDGTQAINTGYFVNPKTRVEFDFQVIKTNNQDRFWGQYDGTNNALMAYIGGGNYFNVASGDGSWTSGAKGQSVMGADTERHTLIADNKNRTATIYTDGTLTGSINLYASTTTSPYPMAIFGHMVNTYGTWAQNRSKIRLYGMKIYDDDVLVRDYEPVLCGGVAGLYDHVRQNFVVAYLPQTMIFAYGGDIRTIKADPYVESNGTAIMNTRHFASPTTKFEIDFAMVATNASKMIAGAHAAGVEHRMAVYLTSNRQIGMLYGDAQRSNWTYKDADFCRHRVVIDYPTRYFAYFTGDSITAQKWIDEKMFETNVTKTAVHPMALFGAMSDATGTKGTSETSKVRIYGCKIWEGGVLKHDYRPCKKGGIVGFRDEVDGWFIRGEENASAFTAGGDIPEFEDDAYISTPHNGDSNGLCYVETGYTPGPNTKVTLDYSLLNLALQEQQKRWWYLFSGQNGKNFDMYVHYSYKDIRYYLEGNENVSTGIARQDDVRRQVTLDAFNDKAVVCTGNFTNSVKSVKSGTGTNKKTLKIAIDKNAASLSGAMKIYGFKIYESDELVYDYKPYVKDGVPGLYDSAKDSFVTCPTDGRKQFMAGGNIEGLVKDAYLESDGTGIINSGYLPTANSKIVIDFMLLSTNLQSRILSSEGGTGTLRTAMYVNGGSCYSMGILDVGSAKDYATASKRIDMYRHTATIDAFNKKYSLVGGGLDWSANSTNTTTRASSHAMGIFGQPDTATWNKLRTTTATKMRIYSVKIYDSDVLAHQFLPYVNGSTVGFKDTVTGNILTDAFNVATAFSVGGAGTDGSGKTIVSGMENGEIDVGLSKTITAYAPGAQSYVWTVDGEESTTTTDTITLNWRKNAKQIVVTCTPMFLIDGVKITGTTSTATYTLLKSGLTILLK